MPDVSLAGALPKGDANGLDPIVSALVEDPRGMHVVLAIVDCKKITTNADTGEVVPTIRVRRIEAILTEDKPLAQRLMRRALETRSGRTTLPMSLEDDLIAAFEDTDGDDTTPQAGDR